MYNTPNIFNYATSELSQDAFLAWLIEWSDPKYKIENEKLHSLGKAFLESLIAIEERKLSDDYKGLKIRRQYHKIDVFVTFESDGEKIALIIEDKVGSSNHSNQLDRYLKKIKSKDYDKVIPIYFKTEFQHSFKEIIGKGYSPYTIKDFLKVLKKGIEQGIDNAILINYYQYIMKKEEKYDRNKSSFENYKEFPVNEWNWWACTGFFNDNQELFNAKWESVPNTREPLLAFPFGFIPLSIIDVDTNETITIEPYLDIKYSDSKKITIDFRLWLKGHQQQNNRNKNHIYDKLYPYLQNNHIKHKKTRFKKAKQSLLLAQIVDFNDDLYHNQLIDLLDKYKSVLHSFVKNYPN